MIATGCGSVNSAIEALRLGAFDYITKPVIDFDRDLLSVVEKGLQRREQRLAEREREEASDADTQLAREAMRHYDALDAIATNLLHGAEPGNFDRVAELFRTHLGATSGFVAEHGSARSLLHVAWGEFADANEYALPPSDEVSFWRPFLMSSGRWEAIDEDAFPADTALSEQGANGPLEVLRVPLAVGTSEGSSSTSLFAVRPRSEEVSSTRVRVGLLSLLVRAVLAEQPVTASPA